MAEPAPTVFTPTRPLAPRTLIEASAGTGKTYALCGLTAYLVGSGTRLGGREITIDDFLVVTFTNLATEDLRNRIRERLVKVRDTLTTAGTGDVDDDVVRALRGDPDAPERLDRAVSELGNLAVSTIHGFAQRSIALFGGDAGLDPDLEVVGSDTASTRGAVADELAVQAEALEKRSGAPDLAYAAAFAVDGLPHEDELSWIPPARRVLDIVQLRSAVPDLVIRPADATAGTFPALVERHRQLYRQARIEALAEIEAQRAASDEGTITKKALGTIADALAVRFDELELVRSAWVAARAFERAEQRRAGQGVRSYGDLLVHLRDALASPNGATLASEIRGRHRVALVDEFQDTDRVQWEIFERCFGVGDESRLVVVGDPKQAIYRFRGADVHTYQRVAGLPEMTTTSLTTNHRSDEAVVHALDTLLQGTEFGAGVRFTPVTAAPRNAGSRIGWRDADADTPPLCAVRLVTEGLVPEPDLPKPGARFDDDLIDWIRRLHARAELRRSDGASTPVSYQDIAVLVPDNQRAFRCQQRLARHGIPVVVYTDDDVRLDPVRSSWDVASDTYRPAPSEAAWNWRVLLEAIARPSDPGRARAAVTSLFAPDGVDWAAAIATDFEPATASVFEHFQTQLARWARTLTDRGAADLIAQLRNDTPWLGRATRRDDGGRLATDVEHIGELLIAQVGTGATSADALLRVLEPDDETEPDSAQDTARRLASDAPAVTIMTIHKAKGLEFPIVFVLDLYQGRAAQRDTRGRRKGARFHDATTGEEILDVARDPASLEAEQREAEADDRRKLYVALTRACSHLVLYWRAPARVPGPLHQLLTARTRAEHDLGPDEPVEVGPVVLEAVARRAEMAGPDGDRRRTFGWVDVADLDIDPDRDPQPGRADPSGDVDAPSVLAAATLGDRHLDRSQRQWSFSAVANVTLTGEGTDLAVPVAGGRDEGHDPPAGDRPEPTALRPTGLLQPFAGGATFGTFVHELLQVLDFAATPQQIRTAVDGHPRADLIRRVGRPAQARDRDDFAHGLHAAFRAPIGRLGPAGSVLRLADISASDRLAECDFDLRLDTPTDGPPTGRRIGEILLDHLPGDDPYRPWATSLTQGRFDLDLRGYLTGSIDLIYRVRHPDGPTRFHISDYKTNTNPDGDYGRDALVEMMTRADYPLQALLYQVALHRYLRWRLPDHDPHVHLGATTYLFLRGMTGEPHPTDPDPPGVARWDIPVEAVLAVDDLFAGSSEPRP